MREVTVKDREFQCRALKVKEEKALRKKGINLLKVDFENIMTAVDEVFEMVFSGDDLAFIEDMDRAESMPLYSAVLAETYGSPKEEKNS
jgi:hypothetical protein